MYFSLYVERKVPKERHQRAKRPLDTRLACMGLFDRGDTRRGIRKALRQSVRRRFSHAPAKLNPKQMRGHRRLLCFLIAAPQGKKQTTRWAVTPKLSFTNKRNGNLAATAKR